MTENLYEITFSNDTSKFFIDNDFCGLWKLSDFSMGGPFYSKIIRDTLNKRLIFMESFASNPNNNKRDIMIQNREFYYKII